MRALLSKKSKKELYQYLKKKTDSKTLKELSKNLNIPSRTLEKWFYVESRYIPSIIIPKSLLAQR